MIDASRSPQQSTSGKRRSIIPNPLGGNKPGDEKRASKPREKKPKKEGKGMGARMLAQNSFLSKILDNLHIALENIHLRYESSDRIPYAVGVTLTSLATSNGDILNDKRIAVTSLALYHASNLAARAAAQQSAEAEAPLKATEAHEGPTAGEAPAAVETPKRASNRWARAGNCASAALRSDRHYTQWSGCFDPLDASLRSLR